MAPSQHGKQQQQTKEYDGEPGCQTLEEVNKMFRNFWDPTTYWQCGSKLGESAKLCRCPATQLFSEKHGSCVHYTDWTPPTENIEPPSRPKSH